MSQSKAVLKNLAVKESSIHGKGLFSLVKIKKNQHLGDFEGPVVRRNGPYVMWVSDESTGEEVGRSCRNKLRYLNHDSEPNAEFDVETDQWRLYALKSIKPGDEITISYGDDFERGC